MTLKALTLRHPWAWAIAYAGKNVENRDWSDDLARLNNIHGMIGEQVAIHGGAAPVRPKRAVPLHKLAESNLWRQHCEDLQAVHTLLDGNLPDAAARYLAQTYPGQSLTPEMFITPGIVAVATVERVTRASQSAWAMPDHLHIELSEVRVLPSPVECPGMQGLWRVPEAVERDVRAQLTAWSVAQLPTPEQLDRLSAAEILR